MYCVSQRDEEWRRMEQAFWDKQPDWGDEQHNLLPRLPYHRARSALFIDPMLLTAAAGVAVAIAIAIPIEGGQARRGGSTVRIR
jgi:hypothetical protein